jgi:hypothetical protein
MCARSRYVSTTDPEVDKPDSGSVCASAGVKRANTDTINAIVTMTKEDLCIGLHE